MTRTGIIREAIIAEGGAPLVAGSGLGRKLFIDGPEQFYHYGTTGREKQIVNYKAETYSLWNTDPNKTNMENLNDIKPQLDAVVARLQNHPDVHKAYITHGGKSFDIRVQFIGVIPK